MSEYTLGDVLLGSKPYTLLEQEPIGDMVQAEFIYDGQYLSFRIPNDVLRSVQSQLQDVPEKMS